MIDWVGLQCRQWPAQGQDTTPPLRAHTKGSCHSISSTKLDWNISSESEVLTCRNPGWDQLPSKKKKKKKKTKSHHMYKVQIFSFIEIYNERRGLPGGTCKELACQCRRHERHKFDPRVRKIPWRRARQTTPVFLPGESHGQRSLPGYRSQRVGHNWSNLAQHST